MQLHMAAIRNLKLALELERDGYDKYVRAA